MSEPKTEQPPAPVVLTVNAIIDGKWYAAGEPLPFASAAAVPDPLKPFVIISEDDADEPPGPPGIRFEPGRVYNVNPEGAIITRHGAREAARLAGEASAQQQAEEEALAAGTLAPETEAILRREHEFHISGAILSAQLKARDADAVVTAARGEGAGGAEQEPADPLYVKRGGAWARAERARLRPGEPVFVKRPTGAWEAVGVVDASGGLPPPEVTL